MTEWLTVMRRCGTEDTLCHHAGSWIPLDLELSHTTASSSLRSRQQSLVWITACPRKTCQIKFGICRWEHVEMSAYLMIPSLSCVCRIFFYSSLISQRQIAQGIKFGQRPSSLRRSEGDEGSSDEEEVPRSPLKVLAQVETEPPKTEPKVKT